VLHGLVKGEAQDLNKEVNGVAGPVPLGPAPIAVFDDQAGKGGQQEVARALFEQLGMRRKGKGLGTKACGRAAGDRSPRWGLANPWWAALL
jgi:hypothetical protein